MAVTGVVVADVSGNLLSGNRFVFVTIHFQFSFDRPKAGLHERFVVAVARATHALPHPGTFQDPSILVTEG
jgi:hypothetical protein